jgi:predicted dithiol-disulfide oxidoreductase (DUF899 family)
MTSTPAPAITDRATFTAELDKLRAREKAHTRAGDAIAAARRRLPMVEVDASLAVTGPDGPVRFLDVFEGRRQLIVHYFMWHDGQPAARQCEGCTWMASRISERSYLHSHDITYAVACQGPYDASVRYRDFMGWTMPWYSAFPARDALLAGRQLGLFHVVCYLRIGTRVFETYWTTGRGVEALNSDYGLMDLTVYGRQEAWEDSPAGWPRDAAGFRSAAGAPDWPAVSGHADGRPVLQWARLAAGRSDDLGRLQSEGCEPPANCC